MNPLTDPRTSRRGRPRSAPRGIVRARLMRAGGAARYSELVRDTADRTELVNLVRSGAVLRAGRGTYVVQPVAPELVSAARFDGLVTCVSAARLHGLPLLDPPARPHLLVPRNRSGGGRSRAELETVVLHRADHDGGTSPHTAGRVQDPARALARMLACCPRDDAVVALDHALYKRLVTRADVARHLGPRAPDRVRRALALADAGGQSIIETLARLALVDAGFAVRTQPSFAGVGDVDLLVEGRVIVECDGYEFHSSRAAFRKDRRRDRVLHAYGYVVLRFTYEDIVDDPGCVVRAVRRVLAAQVAHGPVEGPVC